MRDMMMEALFLTIYGSPLLHPLVGFGPQVAPERPRVERDLAREATEARPVPERLSMAKLKAMFREQYLLVRLDEQRGIRAIPKLLPASQEELRAALDVINRVFSATGPRSPQAERRLREIEALFGVKGSKSVKDEVVHA